MSKTHRSLARTPALPLVLKGLGLAVGVILIAALALVAHREASRPGELVFAQESVDLGQVPVGQAVIYRFSMRNAGHTPVTITKKTASALEGC